MKPDLRPMLATLTDKPFDDPDWIFETKWDGFRLMAEIKDGSAALYSRNLIDLSRKYPSVCAALRGLHRFAVIDGELVALDARGRSRFQLLQNAEREKVRLRYCAFDLIYLDDQDLRDHPLIERKELLEKILPRDPLLHYSAHVWDKGIAAFKRASRAGEEGVMAKFARGHYCSGQRTREWLKVKASLGQEVVIVGFTAPRRSREYFGSLVLAVREGQRDDPLVVLRVIGATVLANACGPCIGQWRRADWRSVWWARHPFLNRRRAVHSHLATCQMAVTCPAAIGNECISR